MKVLKKSSTEQYPPLVRALMMSAHSKDTNTKGINRRQTVIHNIISPQSRHWSDL
jgi:hypothetical protein